MDKKSIFIRLLEFGEKKGVQGFKGDEYNKWKAEQSDIVNAHGDSSREARSLLNTCFDQYTENTGFKYVLKTEYYFRLIEFKELELSRKASSTANRNSIIATMLAVLSIGIGSYFGYIQKTSSIKIDSDQVSLMTPAKSFKIESEQLSQMVSALKQSNINTAELARIMRELNAKLVVSEEVTGKL
jgi:hypothetical protein